METMEINAPDARRILKMLGGWTVSELLEAGTLDLVAKLSVIGQGGQYSVYINVGPGRKVEGIKLIRTMTGSGLKEAKDHYERYDMNSVGNDVLVGVYSLEDAEAVRARAEDLGYYAGDIRIVAGVQE